MVNFGVDIAHIVHLGHTLGGGLRASICNEKHILAFILQPLDSSESVSNLNICLPYDPITVKKKGVVLFSQISYRHHRPWLATII